MSTAAPRQRNAPRTKAKILEAAQNAFADLGYTQAGIRDIAAMADVSSTLLLRYYGSKAGLFEAALIESMNMEEVFKRGRAGFGEYVAELLLGAEAELKSTSMIGLATADDEAREISARVADEYAIAPLAKWLGPPDARVRALSIVILGSGFVLYARQLGLMPGSKGAELKLVKWFSDSLQAIVDQE